MNSFIEIVADYLNKRQTTVSPNTDWDKIIDTADKHELTALLYYQCKGSIPTQYLAKLEQANRSALFYYFNRAKEEQQIRKSMEEEGIRCFTIKGSAIAAFYPHPYLRSMGDSDFVIDASNMDDAHKIMLQGGYSCISVGEYLKKRMMVEIHRYLADMIQINTVRVVEFFNSYWDYFHDGQLDWSFHFLYLLFHLRSHLIGSGVGLRQFADTAVLTKYNQDLNWPWIKAKLIELDMWNFAQKVFALNSYWFQIKPPIESEDAEEIFLSLATEQILKNGVFGFADKNNRANRILMDNRMKGHSPITIMLKRAIASVFPKYKFMIRMPQYAFLKGKPYFLPVAWIYRGFYTIKNRGFARAKAVLETSFTTQEAIDERKALFEKWGLRDSEMQ
ncbi:MAG: nucleotidyltransferase family protein [Clostridia bacterium]|nr:nucleotidyltransferase family protein [Clostridia bacterium]